MTIQKIALGALLLLLLPAAAFAADLRGGDEVALGTGETIEDDLYAAGGNVNIASSVQGDMLVAGGNLLLSGSTTADTHAVGGNVTITGNTGDDLRVVGGTVVIQGNVGGDLVVAGGQVTVAANANIAGDVVVAGGSVSILGPVGGDLRAFGGRILVGGAVGGNVEADADELVLASAANISGNLTYRSPSEADIREGAVIGGEVAFESLEREAMLTGAGILAIIGGFFVLKFLAMLIAALLFGLFFRRYTAEVVETGLSNFGFEMLRGFIAVVVIPVAAGIALVSIIGIPLGILLILGYIGLLIMGAIYSAILAGSLIHKWVKKPEGYVVSWKTILLGSVALSLVTIIPFVGWIITLAFFLMSVGAILRFKWDIAKSWR